MSPLPTPLRIASVSGSVTDRRHAFAEIARNEDVQYIVGDWMSEYNMTMRGGAKSNPRSDSAEFETSFMEAIEPALEALARRHIKVAVNAGASDPEKLHDELTRLIKSQGLDLKVAWISGDEVLEQVQNAIQSGDPLVSLTTGKKISEWGFTPIYAQCYLGCWGIVEALNHGADIVLCGRVTDASPTMACAAHHFSWQRTSYDELAHAFVAAHLIECSTYVTGGNFSGFKSLHGMYLDIAFPIAEISPSGRFTITKSAGEGMVTVDTCKAQLLYEIQGPYYYNPDVVAVLDGIVMEQEGQDRVSVSQVKSIKPPPTTKVGITANGGYQAEAHYFLCGLDIAEKAEMIERQVRNLLDEPSFHTLKFRCNGSCPPDPANQDAATVDFRIFAQSRDESALSLHKFFRPCSDTIMQSYPGATFAVDARQALPKPYYEYFVTVLPQDQVNHTCHLPFKGVSIPIKSPLDTVPFLYEQPSFETKDRVDLSSFGPTTRGPIGWIVHARSGDKGSDCNVGFFVRHSDEWDWLRSMLTIDMVRKLLGQNDEGKPIFRFELPHLWSVHFLLKDHLDRGVSSSSTYDVLGKNLAEYLRCKFVDIPNKFLERGKI